MTFLSHDSAMPGIANSFWFKLGSAPTIISLAVRTAKFLLSHQQDSAFSKHNHCTVSRTWLFAQMSTCYSLDISVVLLTLLLIPLSLTFTWNTSKMYISSKKELGSGLIHVLYTLLFQVIRLSKFLTQFKCAILYSSLEFFSFCYRIVSIRPCCKANARLCEPEPLFRTINVHNAHSVKRVHAFNPQAYLQTIWCTVNEASKPSSMILTKRQCWLCSMVPISGLQIKWAQDCQCRASRPGPILLA